MNKETIETIKDKLTAIHESDLHDTFDSFLDDIYGMVKIGPYDYECGRAMKRVDPIAYDEAFNNWLDSESETYTEIDGDYYDTNEVNELIDSLEESDEESA